MKASDRHPPAPERGERTDESDVARLARFIKIHAPRDGCFELRFPGVFAIRRSRTYAEIAHGLQQSALCIVAQGRKSVMVGPDVFEYDTAHMIAFTVDMPVAYQVTQASYTRPFLSLRLDLEPSRVARLVLKVFPKGLPPVRESRGVFVGRTDADILNAAARLVELMARPAEAELIAPLVVDDRHPGGPTRSPKFERVGSRESGHMGAGQFPSTDESPGAGPVGEHERFLVPPALQIHHLDEPPAVPESATSSGSEAPDDVADDGRGERGQACGVCQRFAVQ